MRNSTQSATLTLSILSNPNRPPILIKSTTHLINCNLTSNWGDSTNGGADETRTRGLRRDRPAF